MPLPNEFLRFHNLAQRGKSEYGLFDVIRTHGTVFNGTSPFFKLRAISGSNVQSKVRSKLHSLLN